MSCMNGPIGISGPADCPSRDPSRVSTRLAPTDRRTRSTRSSSAASCPDAARVRACSRPWSPSRPTPGCDDGCMSADGVGRARAVLEALQDAVDSREPERLIGLFADPAVLIGTSGDGRDRTGLRAYLTEVATQPESLRWDWQDIVPFHDEPDLLAFAAFGEVVVSDEATEQRAPIRASLVAAAVEGGWRIKHFHGSIPSGV